MRRLLAVAFACECLTLFLRADEIAHRIVSLAPNLTELIYALHLDSSLVGRSSACDFPAEVTVLPVAGDFGRPAVEAVLALKPDLLLLTDVEQPTRLAPLRQAGIRIESLPCESWSGIAEAAEQIARWGGRPEKGAAWARTFRDRVAAVQVRSTGLLHRPTVFAEIWANPLTTPARSSFLGQLIETAGGRSIGRSLEGTYATVQAEWVLAESPDMILLAYMPASAAPSDAALRSRAGWGQLHAVQNGRIIRGIDPDLLLRPGPRIIEGCERLAEEIRRLDPVPVPRTLP